jgi:hypothetical protein
VPAPLDFGADAGSAGAVVEFEEVPAPEELVTDVLAVDDAEAVALDPPRNGAALLLPDPTGGRALLDEPAAGGSGAAVPGIGAKLFSGRSCCRCIISWVGDMGPLKVGW